MTSSNPAAELVLLVTGYRVSQAIHVAATLGIADLIKDGAASASDLAVATNSHAGALYRVLRALAAAGVFHEDDEKRFSLTPLGECLRSDAERSMAAWASFVGRPHQWQAWGSLSHSVRTGENAYRHVHGVGLWDYLVGHPEEAAIFDRAMTVGSRGVVEAIAAPENQGYERWQEPRYLYTSGSWRWRSHIRETQEIRSGHELAISAFAGLTPSGHYSTTR